MLIKIPKTKFNGPFSLKLCIDSEQCLADLWQSENGKYKTFIKQGRKWLSIEVWENAGTLFLKTPKDVSKKVLYQFWADYDVLDFYSKFRSDKYLSKAIKLLQGLRVMRNLDFHWGIFEAICTQNSSVKQIRRMESSLRELCGDGFSIDAQKLVKASESKLKQKCKVGYRAKYLIGMAREIVTGKMNPELLQKMNTAEARRSLTGILGIGPKVADIILLYTLSKPDTFPMDVWLKRALIREYFKGKERSNKELRDFALNYFGNHAGIAHLYIFCYERKILRQK